MEFEELCCESWEDAHFNVVGSMELEADQDPSAETDNMISAAAKIYTVCTQAANGEAIAQEAHTSQIEFKVECTKKHILPEELQGNAEFAPGEVVLRERLEYFAKQQMPMANVPTCASEVASCANGRTVTTVNQAWIDDYEKGALLLQEEGITTRGVNAALLTSGSFTMMAGGGL